MTCRAIITRILLFASFCMAASSCTMRYACDRDVSSISLARTKWPHGGSQAERVSAYLPRGERRSGFEITRVDSIREGGHACGNPLIVTVMTLGVVPATIPIWLDVTATGKDRGKAATRHYRVAMDGRYSVWNTLFPRFLEDRAIARSVLDSVDRDQRRGSAEMTETR